jgi:hypothetical protein
VSRRIGDRRHGHEIAPAVAELVEERCAGADGPVKRALAGHRRAGSIGYRRRPRRPDQVHANAAASGIELRADTLAAIDETLDDAPVKEPTLAPFARPSVARR